MSGAHAWHVKTTTGPHLRRVDEDCKVGAVLHEVGVADVVLGHACVACTRRCLIHMACHS